jgi:hypothetical protein
MFRDSRGSLEKLLTEMVLCGADGTTASSKSVSDGRSQCTLKEVAQILRKGGVPNLGEETQAVRRLRVFLNWG